MSKPICLILYSGYIRNPNAWSSKKIHEYLARQFYDYHVLVVDDNTISSTFDFKIFYPGSDDSQTIETFDSFKKTIAKITASIKAKEEELDEKIALLRTMQEQTDATIKPARTDSAVLGDSEE